MRGEAFTLTSPPERRSLRASPYATSPYHLDRTCNTGLARCAHTGPALRRLHAEVAVVAYDATTAKGGAWGPGRSRPDGRSQREEAVTSG